MTVIGDASDLVFGVAMKPTKSFVACQPTLETTSILNLLTDLAIRL